MVSSSSPFIDVDMTSWFTLIIFLRWNGCAPNYLVDMTYLTTKFQPDFLQIYFHFIIFTVFMLFNVSNNVCSEICEKCQFLESVILKIFLDMINQSETNKYFQYIDILNLQVIIVIYVPFIWNFVDLLGKPNENFSFLTAVSILFLKILQLIPWRKLWVHVVDQHIQVVTLILVNFFSMTFLTGKVVIVLKSCVRIEWVIKKKWRNILFKTMIIDIFSETLI